MITKKIIYFCGVIQSEITAEQVSETGNKQVSETGNKQVSRKTTG